MVRLWDHVLHVKTSKIRDKLSRTGTARDVSSLGRDEDAAGKIDGREILIWTGHGKPERVVAYPTKPKHASLHAAKKAVERSIIANDESSVIWNERSSPSFEIYQEPAYPNPNSRDGCNSAANSRSHRHNHNDRLGGSATTSRAGSRGPHYGRSGKITPSIMHNASDRQTARGTHKSNEDSQMFCNPEDTFAQTVGRDTVEESVRRPRSAGRLALKTLDTPNDRERYSNLHHKRNQNHQDDPFLNIPELSCQTYTIPY